MTLHVFALDQDKLCSTIAKDMSALEAKSGAKRFGSFLFPQIHDNLDGWGPCEVPEQFRDTPYQPFSKDDRLGKVRE